MIRFLFLSWGFCWGIFPCKEFHFGFIHFWRSDPFWLWLIGLSDGQGCFPLWLMFICRNNHFWERKERLGTFGEGNPGEKSFTSHLKVELGRQKREKEVLKPGGEGGMGCVGRCVWNAELGSGWDENREQRRDKDNWEVFGWWIRALNCFLGIRKGKLLKHLGSPPGMEAGRSGLPGQTLDPTPLPNKTTKPSQQNKSLQNK